MSTKWLIGLVVVVALIAGALYMFGSKPTQGPAGGDMMQDSQTGGDMQQSGQQQPQQGTQARDTSDAGLANDAAAIDAQIQATTDANTSANESDTPISQ